MSSPTFGSPATLHAADLDAADPVAPPPSPGRTLLPRFERDGDRLRVVREERARYEIDRPLGAGGMGEVRLALDHDIGRKVAIKRLHRELERPAILSRFVSEIRTIGQLDHPNIVPVHDVGVDEDGSLFFVMKYVDGETLEAVLDRLRRGDAATHAIWSSERRVQVARGVLRALEVAHAHGIVHRDVKPANVMVGPYGEVVLTDWGIARMIGATEAPAEPEAAPGAVDPRGTTRAGTLLGTPRYLSPEQLRGEHDRLDGRSDLYAFGLLLYELLTLRLPSDEVTDLDGLRRVLELDPPLPVPRHQLRHAAQPVAAPADVLWVCWRLTRRDPADRPADVQAVLAELDAIEEGRCRVQCPPTLAKRLAGEGDASSTGVPGSASRSSRRSPGARWWASRRSRSGWRRRCAGSWADAIVADPGGTPRSRCSRHELAHPRGLARRRRPDAPARPAARRPRARLRTPGRRRVDGAAQRAAWATTR